MLVVKRTLRTAAALLALLAPSVAVAACEGAHIPGIDGRVLLLAEGDSITFGQQSSDGRSYVQRACVLKANHIDTVVAAVSRSVLGGPSDPPGTNSLYGRMRADNALLAHKNGRLAVLSVLIGRNDLVGYQGGPRAYADALAAYVQAMRKAGWDRVIVGTELPSDWPPFDPLRDRLDAILLEPGWARARGIDVIADFAADPAMGDDGDAANKTFYADGIHPNDRGYEHLAPIYSAALRRVLTRR